MSIKEEFERLNLEVHPISSRVNCIYGLGQLERQVGAVVRTQLQTYHGGEHVEASLDSEDACVSTKESTDRPQSPANRPRPNTS